MPTFIRPLVKMSMYACTKIYCALKSGKITELLKNFEGGNIVLFRILEYCALCYTKMFDSWLVGVRIAGYLRDLLHSKGLIKYLEAEQCTCVFAACAWVDQE